MAENTQSPARIGWSGGQFSLFRTAAGLLLVATSVQHFPWNLLFLTLGVLIASGLKTRWAATILLLLTAGCLFGGIEVSPLLLGLGLVLGAAPGAPWLSLEARGRVDPDGGWRLPGWYVPLTRCVALGVLVWLMYSRAFFSVPILWTIWFVLFAFNPGWIPPRRPQVIRTVFYDGSCGLCHGAVRFLLAEDREGSIFRFSPLGSETFQSTVSSEIASTLPDSVVVCDPEEGLFTRSTAILAALDALGGWWRAAAVLGRIVPRGLRDLTYDAIARIRKRLFQTPKSACPILPPHLRSRFLP